MSRAVALPALLAAAALGAAVASAPLAAQERGREANAFTWSGAIPAGRWIHVRDTNGDVRVERGTGAQVEVIAEKRWSGGAEPGDVRVVVQKAADGESMVVCALWYDGGTCDVDDYRGGPRGGWGNRGSLSVHFVVRVPAGVHVDVSSVNGGLDIAGATAEVRARTVNGGIVARSAGGPVVARTVNGSIDARMAAVGDARELDFSTTNGSVTVEMPTSLGARVEMSTVNGRVETEFPVTVSGRLNPRRLDATIGGCPSETGGCARRLRLRTVNGSVRLRKADG